VRHTLETAGLLGAALAVSICFSSQAEKIFAITGSTGVCMACYVLPICIYRRERHLRWKAYQQAIPLDADPLEALSSPLLGERSPYRLRALSLLSPFW
jgi:hypothetical protein